MKKLFTRIAGIAIGASLLVGFGFASKTANVFKAKATTSPANIDLTTNTTTSASDDALVWDFTEFTVTASKESGTKVTNYWPGTGASHTRLYNNNKITFAPKSGYQLDSMSITATSSSYLKVATTATNATVATSGAVANVTPTVKTSNVVLTCNGTGRYNMISVAFSAASTTPEIALSSSSVYIATTTIGSIDVGYANLSSNISVSQTGASVSLSTDKENWSSSLSLDKSLTSPQTVYVKGTTVGTSVLSFASTGATSKSASVQIELPTIYKQITKTAEVKDGGRFLIAVTGTEILMSNNQLSNGRGGYEGTLVDGDFNLPSVSGAAVLTFAKATGDNADYYTIFDPSYGDNGGYLEYYSGNLVSYATNNPTSNAFLWSLSFDDDGHAVLANKNLDGYVLQWNNASNGQVFRMYTGAQTKIDLFELEADIPSSKSLTSITASNASVGEGSVIHFSGSYLPVDATEEIVVSIDDEIATLGSLSMSNGTFSLSITGGSVASTTSTTVRFKNQSGSIERTITLTVADYTPTHTLVTATSSLVNGAKVIFAPTNEDQNYSGGAHTGGNYIPIVTTAFADDRTSLAAAEGSKEYTIWSVSVDENTYYVFSDGNYFLCAASSKNNYLQRTDVLNERCYFSIETGETGVVISSVFSVSQSWEGAPYVVKFNSNSGQERISLYAGSGAQNPASLYISNSGTDTVQGFIDVFMHMPHTSENGYCADANHHYYSDAKAAFNALTSAQREDFCTEAAYEDAYDRLVAWASANGEEFDGSYALVAKAVRTFDINETNQNVIFVLLGVSAALMASLLILKKKRHN